MEDDIKEIQVKDNNKSKVSLLSIIGFVILILPFALMPIISFLFPPKEFNPKEPTDLPRLIIGIGTSLCYFSSFVISIIDLFLKNRRKVFSIITLIISGFIILLFLFTFLQAV